MSTAVPLIDEASASAEVRAVYDDIKKTRDTDYINNFWRVLANDPATLKRIWGGLKEVMAPGALDWTCPVLVERHRVIRHWFFRTEPDL